MLAAMSPMTVRLAVSDILDRQNMTTAEFSSKAGLTYNQALAIRRGAYSRLDLDTLAKICDALGVMPGELFVVEKSEAH